MRPSLPQVPRCAATGRIAAYVALHGHGTYPTAGRVFRHFFCGNDLCSAVGPAWRPRRAVLLPPLHEAGRGTLGSVAAPRRTLMRVPSRGSQLPAAACCAEERNPALDSRGTANGSSRAAQGSSTTSAAHAASLPEVLANECCAWLEFRGQWGTTDAPAVQAWFSNAEPPVSRSALQRLFLHPWPELKTL